MAPRRLTPHAKIVRLREMPKFEIVYFTGCPLIDRARRALRDGKLVAGARTGPSSCSIVDWAAVSADLQSRKTTS